MTDIKALFFDIDGTLVSFSTHTVPPSAVKALTMAKSRGLRIFISTGRAMGVINHLNPIEPLIDGYITTNGAYSTIGDRTVACHPMADADVQAILADADKEDYPVIVVGERTIVIYNPKPIVERIFGGEIGITSLDPSLTLAALGQERILQMTPFITLDQQEHLAQRLDGCTFGRWHPEFVDINPAGIDKALGLHEMARHLGIDTAQTMAFGDGGNDIPILRAAGIGVAMGNSAAEVRQAADYVTAHIDHDGVAQALGHYGLV